MVMYHINPETGEPGPCRARKKCPFGGEEVHFENQDDARKNFERQQQLLLDAQLTKPKASPFTNAAFASNLKYSRRPPRWFRKMPTTLQENVFGCKPELLDVIDGPSGKLAVVWEDNSIEPNDIWVGIDRGYNTTRLTLRDYRSGKIQAYLKTSYQTPESHARSFGDDEWSGFRYLAQRRSFWAMEKTYADTHDYSPSDQSISRTKIEPPELNSREQLVDFNRKARETLELHGRAPLENMNESELRQELSNLQDLANEQLKIELKNYETPYIEFSRVEEPLRGKGLGHSLYIYSARKLAEKGLALRASGTQTPEAQKSWRLMAADKRFPITVENWLYKTPHGNQIHSAYILDFRESSKEESIS